MKIMTFNFTAGMVLVVKAIEFIVGLIAGLIINILDHIAYKFEEGSFLRKVYCWIESTNSYAFVLMVCQMIIIAAVLSILSVIF